ncbi:MAG TPA: hypothetical protein VHI77_01260, partial [Solirubrobacterales bacterium]|nr:hypothetical protein [Solirubrobacterales bacterium]
DFFSAIGKIGAVAGYYDGNGHYVRASPSALNLFALEGETLKPIAKSEAFKGFGPSAPVRRPCPGAATQRAPDGSNPFVGPGSVSSSECNPSDLPPGE